MIGIGYTTRNRRDIAEKSISECRKYLPPGARLVIVDDASTVPYPGATFRFNENAGIAAAKNKCLELLDDCQHIFLFDDDCHAKANLWHLPYINSGIKHLSFTFEKLFNGRKNGNNKIAVKGKFTIYNKACGCMLYFHRSVLDVVGGFDPAYKSYSYEHLDLSNRIFNAGLTPHRFMDVSNSLSLLHSEDYYGKITSSIQNRNSLIAKNKMLYDANYKSKEFKPYKRMVKDWKTNVVLTAYFRYANDPQRNVQWANELKAMQPLSDSCKKHGVKLIIFHDCKNVIGTDCETIRINPSLRFSPNVYRWLVFNDYLKDNKYNKVFLVDSTDVEMLKNPFSEMEHGLIYAGDEVDMKTDNRWMKTTQEPYIRIADYRAIIERYANTTLINCGLIGSDYETILKLLDIWTGIHKKGTEGIVKSTDMAVFNYTIHKYFHNIISHGAHINTHFKKFEKDNKVAWWRHK